MKIEPFEIRVPDAVLADLRARLSQTRFLADSPRRQPSGMSSSYLRELVASWQVFDWRSREEWLNRHPQFVAEIDDASIHFAHLRSER